MANLSTHLNVAALTGGGLGLFGFGEAGLSLEQAVSGAALVTLGGVLPDIDVDNSKVTRGLFSVIAVFFILVTLSSLSPRPPTWVLCLIVSGAWVLIREGGWYLFAKTTVHRGIYHSLLAGAFFGLLTTGLAFHVFGQSPCWSWAAGAALTLGFIVHLVLDEIYSVDFQGNRLKKSFGTALKPWDFKNPLNSAGMLSVTLVLVWFAPSSHPFRRWAVHVWQTIV